jgi:hypothetical protein
VEKSLKPHSLVASQKSIDLPDWPALWDATVRWAHQPRYGVVVPMNIAAGLAEETLREARKQDVSHTRLLAFSQRAVRERALQRVASARLETGDSKLWGDCSAVLPDLVALQRGDEAAWQSALPVLHEHARKANLNIGISEADSEDISAESIASLLRPSVSGKRPIDGLCIDEQLPSLIASIARRRCIDHLRHAHAARRDTYATFSLDSPNVDAASLILAERQPEIDLQEIVALCGKDISSAHWEIINRHIIHESATITELIADPALMIALGLSPNASESTRRRRVREALDAALKIIRKTIEK